MTKNKLFVCDFCGESKSKEYLAAVYENSEKDVYVWSKELDEKKRQYNQSVLDSTSQTFLGLNQLQKLKNEIKKLHYQINNKKSICSACDSKGKKKLKDPNFKCVICEEVKPKNKLEGDGVKKHIGNYQHKKLNPYQRYPVCAKCDYFFVQRPKGKAPDFVFYCPKDDPDGGYDGYDYDRPRFDCECKIKMNL